MSSTKTFFEIQNWFASVITAPLTVDHKLPLFSPRGVSIEEEAKKFLCPSASLAPHERIQIYYQQYWWRLLDGLQENFPLVTRLFGYQDFNNKIGVPYLTKNPSTHWALSRLGETLPEWIKTDYEGIDKELVWSCAIVDLAALKAFIAEQKTTIQIPEEQIGSLLHQKLDLQPFICLFAFPFDFFAFREEFLKESVEFWQKRSFPKLKKKKAFFTIFRTSQNKVAYEEIKEGEYLLLTHIQQGNTIMQALDLLEAKGGKVIEDACNFLPLWFKRWISQGWIIQSYTQTT